MNVEPFSPGCGALVSGLQLAEVSGADLSSLRTAFAAHGLLFFRDQELDPAAHKHFAERFGTIILNKFFTPVPDFPDIAEVRKEAHQTTNIGGGWHTDHSYDAEPAMGSILVARQLPDSGGNTRFANLAAAYDGLSDALKERIAPLRALHSNKHLYGHEGYYRSTDIADQLGGADSVGDAVHPLVIQHPESRRSVLYVNPGHTRAIVDMDPAEAESLLEQLYAHVDQPQYTCSFDWQPGSVAFWDNRSTWHFAQNDYHGQARLMHRITLKGSALTAPPDAA